MLPLVATVATVATTDARVFAVLLANMSRVQEGLTALNKRATRKGLPLLVWTWGKAYTDERGLARVPLALPVEVPKFAGWSFLAALQHLDGENIVRAIPGATVPDMYRNRGPQCDHCRTNRRRADTYVLRHEDGRTVQVGSTCIGDFLGSDDAGSIAHQASFLATARSLAEDGCEGSGSGAEHDRLLVGFLAMSAFCVRTLGWVSRTALRESGREWGATADLAWLYLTDDSAARKADAKPTDEDRAVAVAAEEWAESLTDETLNAERGDYLHNLRAVARTGMVTQRTAGIAASMITAYQRHLARVREQAERAARPSLDTYVGEVGQKVTFGLPAKTLKNGQPAKGAPVVLSPSPVTLDFVGGYEGAYGYTTILKFRTAEGATLAWFASGSGHAERSDVGKTFTLSGTIKKHDLYKGTKQTTLTRCTLTPTT
jgi:hypothetical protein